MNGGLRGIEGGRTEELLINGHEVSDKRSELFLNNYTALLLK